MNIKCAHILLLSLFAMSMACGNNESNNDTNNTNNENNQTDMSSKDMAVEKDMTEKEDMTQTADMAQDMNTGDDQTVPATSDAIFKYLQAKRYSKFAAEPAVHGSTGPHGQVRSFINDALFKSLEDKNTSHPVGSAAIKELYSGENLRGWAVSVKVTDTNNDGNDWYWYEIFSTTDGSSPVANSTGAGSCAGCHGTGVDSFRSEGSFSK